MARKLKNWLVEYMKYTEHSEAPDKFHFWTGVSTIAGALRRRVWLDMGHFQWTPNFFIFFVAPPGIVNKTTTGNIGMDILKELEYINFGPAAGTWQAMITKMTDCGEEFFLPDGDVMPMTAMTILLSELGTFIDPRNREQIDVLVDLWDGKQGVWTKSTKYSGDETIINPWINILGFTTPSWVAENFSDYFSGGGFMSRSIFIYAENKKKLMAYPKRNFPKDFTEQKQKLINDLGEIASMCGEFELSEAAYEWGEKWYEEHYNSDHKDLSGERFLGYLARKQTHIHKLAMIISASKGNSLIVEEKDLKQAAKIITGLEVDMPKMFGQANREKEMILAAEVLVHIRSKGAQPRTTLYSKFMRTVTYDTFEKILKSLIHGGFIKIQTKDSVVHIIPITTNKKEKKND